LVCPCCFPAFDDGNLGREVCCMCHVLPCCPLALCCFCAACASSRFGDCLGDCLKTAIPFLPCQVSVLPDHKGHAQNCLEALCLKLGGPKDCCLTSGCCWLDNEQTFDEKMYARVGSRIHTGIPKLVAWLGEGVTLSREAEMWKQYLGRVRLTEQAFGKVRRAAREAEKRSGEELNLWFKNKDSEGFRELRELAEQPCLASQLDIALDAVSQVDKDASLPYKDLAEDASLPYKVRNAIDNKVFLSLSDLALRVSGALEPALRNALIGCQHLPDTIKLGPPKTPERIRAKASEYRAERPEHFEASFAKFRSLCPEKDFEDSWIVFKYNARILDYARISVAVKEPDHVVRCVERLKETFNVCGVKNGFSDEAICPPSGYRDVKVLAKLTPSQISRTKPGQIEGEAERNFVFEIQIVLERWLKNKMETSILYKIRRAADPKRLQDDFSKYLKKRS